MSARPLVDDPRVLALASSIAEGAPVNWAGEPLAADPDTSTVLAELQKLEALSQWSDPLPNRWGRYAIRGELGRGSYGTVYRGFDPQLDLEIALKVIRPSANDASPDVDRALTEARLLAQVNHPNVVRVFAAESIDQEAGIAMELVEGRTLLDLVRDQGPLGPGEAMLIGVDLARALAAVHALRLLHGDLKANNVMRAAGGRTVLMDFGAGDDLKQAGSGPRSSAATPIYLAPEVFAGAPRSARSDIYSLGVLLYYLVTGSYPVEGTTRTEVGQQHLASGGRRLLRDVRPDLPDAFIQVVQRATAERPHERYQSAGELEAALHAALGRKPAVPRPTVPLWFRWAASIVLTLLTGTGAWMAWPWSQPAAPASATTTLTATATAPAAPQTPAPAATPDSYQIEAAFFRVQNGRDVRVSSGARVAPGDRLSMRVSTSVPTYVYVVNEDDRGDGYLLFPLPGQSLTNPLPAGKTHEIPGIVDGERIHWQVTSAGGREHFLIFATPQPPTRALARVFESMPRPVAGAPTAERLTGGMASLLRGVGGLAVTPVRQGSAGLSNESEFAVPLPDGAETARGVWVRQLILENPTP